jgi:hypothetical protein
MIINQHDRGEEFLNKTIQGFCKRLGMQLLKKCSKHHQLSIIQFNKIAEGGTEA